LRACRTGDADGTEPAGVGERPTGGADDQRVYGRRMHVATAPGANGPCVAAQFVTSATRVLSNGVPLLLMDSQAICAPTGTPLIPAIVQTRVIGM